MPVGAAKMHFVFCTPPLPSVIPIELDTMMKISTITIPPASVTSGKPWATSVGRPRTTDYIHLFFVCVSLLHTREEKKGRGGVGVCTRAEDSRAGNCLLHVLQAMQ